MMSNKIKQWIYFVVGNHRNQKRTQIMTKKHLDFENFSFNFQDSVDVENFEIVDRVADINADTEAFF